MAENVKFFSTPNGAFENERPINQALARISYLCYRNEVPWYERNLFYADTTKIDKELDSLKAYSNIIIE